MTLIRGLRAASLFLLIPCAVVVDEDAAPQRFTVADAIGLALKNNVDVRVAAARNESARGRALQDAADLLPQIIGTAHQGRVYKVNLAAQGFSSFPGGFDPVLGPFNNFDARIRLSQRIFDMEAIDRTRSSAAARRAADAETAIAREHVAAAAALAYLDVLRARASIVSAQAGDTLAQTLLTQVENQKKAGSAAGIDVARAKTRAAEERLRVLVAQSQEHDALMRLIRVVGLPLGTTVQATDPFQYAEPPSLDLNGAVAQALDRRVEIRASEESVREKKLSLSAESWSHGPSVSASGDYGASGNTPDNSRPTGSAGVDVSMPLWTSGHIGGKREEARGELHEAQARLDDVRAQVEEDVRLAADQVATTAEQVKTSQQAVTLAESELKMARDRFDAGVGSNVDVVDAQTALARVQDAQIAALAGFEAARISQAMALGAAQDFRL